MLNGVLTPPATPEMPSPPPPPVAAGACCRHCGYELEQVVASRCPECGREFDRADARTFARSVRAWKMRKWRRRGAVLALLVVMVAVFTPRGYVKTTITVTCSRCGLKQTTAATRPLAPSWKGEALWVWPGWTETKVEVLPAAGTVCGHDPDFSLAAKKRLWTIHGSKSGGGMTASGGANANYLGTVNKLKVTFDSAARVASAVARNMAGTGSFGVRVGRERRMEGVPADETSAPP